MAINVFKPEIHNKTMMPALESPFFVPHVISYIFAYSLLAAAVLVGIYIIYKKRKTHDFDPSGLLYTSDNLVYTGLAFLMTGLLLGAVWAKQAWGTYWGWDPKETWAAITLLSYLLYIHHRLYAPRRFEVSFALLILSFLFLQICWYGVNYLPSAQGSSIHTYGM
jgi:cytochrome c biogenesis protein